MFEKTLYRKLPNNCVAVLALKISHAGCISFSVE